MKHTILLIAAIAIGTLASAQKPVTIIGTYKEMKRMNPKGEAVSFVDTLHLDLTAKKKYEWLRDGGFTYKGDYTASKDQLDLGMRLFTIVRRMPDQLVLKDDSGSYELHTYIKPVQTENNAAASNSNRGNTAVGSLGEVHKNELAGNWESYKTFQKTDGEAKPIDYKRLIKRVNLTMNGKQITGTVSPSQPGQQWAVERLDGNMIYCKSGTDERTLEILKCANGELVLLEANTTYYFKVFKKQ